MTIRPGDYWVADILFTDRSASKKRPILILWLDANDVIAAAVTAAGPRTQTDVPLADWQASGLRTASTVRLGRLDCLEQSLLTFYIGHISPGDAQQIKSTWDRHVKPQF